MKNQTESKFLINKYRSILFSAAAVEGATFIIAFTDSIVAGNIIGSEALAAVSAVVPYSLLTTFIVTLINAGTTILYSYNIGKYERKKANQAFSLGVLLAVLSGIIILVLLELSCESVVKTASSSATMQGYLRSYYRIHCFYLCLGPLSALLDNTVMSDGGEKLSAFANIFEITTNVILSFILGKLIGISGIALASVISKISFIIIISLWGFTKKSNIRLVPYFSLRTCYTIFQNGIVRALPVLLKALMIFVLNTYVMKVYGMDTFIVLGIVLKFLEMSSLFTGLSQAINPLVTTLTAEKNYVALRSVMRSSTITMTVIGGIFSVFIFAAAPMLAGCFGKLDKVLLADTTHALRIFAFSAIFYALIIHIFIYFYLTKRRMLTHTISALKELTLPIVIGIGLSELLGTSDGIWIGLSAAPLITLIIILVYIRARYGREKYPYLIPHDYDDKIYIYNLDLSTETISDLTRSAMQLIEEKGYARRIKTLAGSMIEDSLMLIKQKNVSEKVVNAECTLITEETGVRIIIRDTGNIDNIVDSDSVLSSFRQYYLTRLATSIEESSYLTTTGYNRNEYFVT